MFTDPKISFIFYASIILLIVSISIGITCPDKIGCNLTAAILAALASSVFFPLIAGYFYDKFREGREGPLFWRIIDQFIDGGILRIYKDREEETGIGNAQEDMRNAFNEHHSGEIQMIGVSLRVFFHSPGPSYNYVNALAQRNGVKIRVLVCSKQAPEVENRQRIEGVPGNYLGMAGDIQITIDMMEKINAKYAGGRLEYGFYNSAPYCTCIVFPEKCYFSPNIPSEETPVRLPMIVFRKDSHGYDVLKKYFLYLWEHKQAQ
jgi:hypothetical protein